MKINERENWNGPFIIVNVLKIQERSNLKTILSYVGRNVDIIRLKKIANASFGVQ